MVSGVAVVEHANHSMLNTVLVHANAVPEAEAFYAALSLTCSKCMA